MGKKILPKIVKEHHSVNKEKYDYSRVEVFLNGLYADRVKDLTFTNLKEVKGSSLSITWSERLSFPKLMTVYEYLEASYTDNISAPVLSCVGASLYLGYSDNANLPMLSNVGGMLGTSHSENLSIPCINQVGGLFVPGDYRGTSSLREVRRAGLGELPILLLKYKENPLLISIIKQRLNKTN